MHIAQLPFWEYINGNQTFILDSHWPFICSEAVHEKHIEESPREELQVCAVIAHGGSWSQTGRQQKTRASFSLLSLQVCLPILSSYNKPSTAKLYIQEQVYSHRAEAVIHTNINNNISPIMTFDFFHKLSPVLQKLKNILHLVDYCTHIG